MTIQAAARYPRISAKSYEHPADRAATAALRSIPLLDRFVKLVMHLGLERRQRQLLLGDAVRLGEDQVPSIWELHRGSASALDLVVPDLYVSNVPIANAMTIGAKRPIVLLSSELVSSYPQRDVHVVLGHELGHVLSDHLYYNNVLYLLAQILRGVMPPSPLTGLPLKAIYMALMEWHRATELSCDRAGAIVVGDPVATCQVLMRLAGGSLPGMNLDAFLRQATQYAEEEDLFARHARLGLELGRSHPFAVRRAKELMDWVSTGALDRILAGSYVRQGEEPPASSEFDAAVVHYRQRFNAMIDRTLGGAAKLTGQLKDWLARQREGAEEGDGQPLWDDSDEEQG